MDVHAQHNFTLGRAPPTAPNPEVEPTWTEKTIACLDRVRQIFDVDLEVEAKKRLLREKEKEVEEKDDEIKKKEKSIQHADYVIKSLRNQHEQLCAGISCAEQILTMRQTEDSLRKELHDSVNRYNALTKQHDDQTSLLIVANKQISDGKFYVKNLLSKVTELGSQVRDHKTTLNDIANLKRTEDPDFAFLRYIRKNTAENAALKAESVFRVKELQELNGWRGDFEKEHGVMKKNTEAEIKIWQQVYHDNVNQSQYFYDFAQDKINELDTNVFHLNTNNSMLQQNNESLAQKVYGLEADVEASKVNAHKYAAHLEDAIAQIDHEHGKYHTLTAKYEADMRAKDAHLQDLKTQVRDACAATDLEQHQSRKVENRLNEKISTLKSRVSSIESIPNGEIQHQEKKEEKPKATELQFDLDFTAAPSAEPFVFAAGSSQSNKARPTAVETGGHSSYYFGKKTEESAYPTALPVDINFGSPSGCKPFAFTAGKTSTYKTSSAGLETREHEVLEVEKKDLRNPSRDTLAVGKEATVVPGAQTIGTYGNNESLSNGLIANPDVFVSDPGVPEPHKSRAERRAAVRQTAAEEKKLAAKQNEAVRSKTTKKEQRAKVDALLRESRV